MVAVFAAGCNRGGSSSSSGGDEGTATTAVSGEEVRFVIVPKCVHAWFDLVQMGGIREANRLSEMTGLKITIDYRVPTAVDVTEQNSILEQAAATKPNGITLDPVDIEGSREVINKIQAEGIPVVLFDGTDPDLTSVGCDFTEMGNMAGEALAKALDYKGNVAIMQGVPTAPNHVERYEAIVATLAKYPDIKVVAEGIDNDDIETAQSQMASIIAANPDLDGVTCVNASGPIGIGNAIKEAGKENDIYAVGMDGIQEILDLVKGGYLDESVASIPQKQGSMAILMLFQAYTGLNDMPKIVDTGINYITQENIDTYMTELTDLYALLEKEGVQE
jgi:ribose transport system substrate-binding protein